jgi:hypothetical protein
MLTSNNIARCSVGNMAKPANVASVMAKLSADEPYSSSPVNSDKMRW